MVISIMDTNEAEKRSTVLTWGGGIILNKVVREDVTEMFLSTKLKDVINRAMEMRERSSFCAEEAVSMGRSRSIKGAQSGGRGVTEGEKQPVRSER